jgi:hypothetical protein
VMPQADFEAVMKIEDARDGCTQTTKIINSWTLTRCLMTPRHELTPQQSSLGPCTTAVRISQPPLHTAAWHGSQNSTGLATKPCKACKACRLSFPTSNRSADSSQAQRASRRTRLYKTLVCPFGCTRGPPLPGRAFADRNCIS